MDNKSWNTYISEMEDFLRVKENFDILCQKLRFTPKGYPRHGGTILKHPL